LTSQAAYQSQDIDDPLRPQSSSVKRRKTSRQSQNIAPYPQPSLLAAVRRKASVALQEALKWPQNQLAKWTTVKKPKEEEEIPALESALLPPSMPSPPPSPLEHSTRLLTADIVEEPSISETTVPQTSSPSAPASVPKHSNIPTVDEKTEYSTPDAGKSLISLCAEHSQDLQISL
jgi:hypothetical protein